MDEETDGFFEGWFAALGKGLDKLDENECSCLFSECARTCSEYVINNMYRELLDECEGNPDKYLYFL